MGWVKYIDFKWVYIIINGYKSNMDIDVNMVLGLFFEIFKHLRSINSSYNYE